MKKIKILYITTSYYPNMQGGSERSLKLFVDGIVKTKGFECVVLSFDAISKETTEEYDGNVKIIRVKKINLNPNTLAYNISLLLNQKTIKKENPDIIHVYNTWQIPGSYFLKKYGKVVATLNNYFPICAIGTTNDGLLGGNDYSFARIMRGNLNSIKGKFIKKSVLSFVYAFYNKINLYLSKEIDGYTTYTYGAKTIYTRAGFDENKIFVIPSVIDKKNYNLPKIKRKKNIALFVGGLIESKGVKELLEAISLIKNKNIEFRIIGKGYLMKELQEFSRKNNLNVKFYGKLEPKEIKKHYLESTLLVHSSLFPEPLSRVWLEALNNNIPIICSETLTSKDCLKDNAVFYNKNDPKELAARISDFFDGKLKIKSQKNKVYIFKSKSIKMMADFYKKWEKKNQKSFG